MEEHPVGECMPATLPGLVPVPLSTPPARPPGALCPPGHCDDFYYFLTEDDYAWITSEICGVATRTCHGRVISVLEGGYQTAQRAPMRGKKPPKKSQRLKESMAAAGI